MSIIISPVKLGNMPYLRIRINYGITSSVWKRVLQTCRFKEPISTTRDKEISIEELVDTYYWDPEHYFNIQKDGVLVFSSIYSSGGDGGSSSGSPRSMHSRCGRSVGRDQSGRRDQSGITLSTTAIAAAGKFFN